MVVEIWRNCHFFIRIGLCLICLGKSQSSFLYGLSISEELCSIIFFLQS